MYNADQDEATNHISGFLLQRRKRDSQRPGFSPKSSSRFQKTSQEFKISGVCLDLRDGGGLRLRNNASERDVDRPRCYPSSFSQANRSRQENRGDRAYMFFFLNGYCDQI